VVRARRQSEMQSALLLHLLHARSKHGRIGDDLHAFILAVHPQLAPADVETTRTGVMRVATTTRDASRTLRVHGLLRDSVETRTRKWELSVLGILVAVELSTRYDTPTLPDRRRFVERFGRFGESERLSEELEEVVRRYAEASAVRAALLGICQRDRDLFETFDDVVNTVATYCQRLAEQWSALDAGETAPDRKAQKARADEMLRVVEAAVPPGAFAEDVNKSLSLDGLPGMKRPSV
jgi:hypothetical protein